MAEKIVKLKLNYQGKVLDVTKKGENQGEIKKKWYIGSDKHIFWQILDPKFPEKHLFLEEKNNVLYMNILPSSELNCMKNGQVVDKTYLKSNNLLSGTQLKLTPDMSGTVALSKDWSINFEFVEPWKRVLSAEEKQIISLYSRRTELLPEEKKSKNLMIFITLFTVLFLMVYDLFLKQPPAEPETLEKRYENLMAQRVEATKIESRIKREQASEAEEEAEEAAEVTTTKKGPTGPSAASLKAAIGGLKDGSSTGSLSQGLTAVTQSRALVARSFGDTGGGRGSGAGRAGVGSGGTSAGLSDPSARLAALRHQGTIATGQLKGSGLAAPVGDEAISKFRGDASTIKPGQRVTSDAAQSALTRVQRTGGIILKEGAIPEGDEEQKSKQEVVNANVGRIRNRIANSFNRHSSVKAMSGSIKFTVIIEPNGNVEVMSEVNSGDFSKEFLDEAISIIKAWRFPAGTTSFEFVQRFART